MPALTCLSHRRYIQYNTIHTKVYCIKYTYTALQANTHKYNLYKPTGAITQNVYIQEVPLTRQPSQLTSGLNTEPVLLTRSSYNASDWTCGRNSGPVLNPSGLNRETLQHLEVSNVISQHQKMTTYTNNVSFCVC